MKNFEQFIRDIIENTAYICKEEQNMDKREIKVSDAGTVVSKIYVEDSLDRLSECLGESDSVFFVYDSNIRKIAEEIRSVVKVDSAMALDVSEEIKTLDTVAGICSWLLDSGADRTSVLLAAGGGILTDIAGFTAAVYMRGIRVAYIPTTLLSQVDASIGGKTGVNLESYKNIIGLIRQPEFTYICPSVVLDLPENYLRAGVAEMLKTFIIADNGFYQKTVDLFSSGRRIGTDDLDTLAELIYAAVKVKSGIVSDDQFEHGVRRKLNLGHTFAHAIEWCANSACKNGAALAFSHGQAVSVGLVLAARLSETLGVAEKGLAEKLKRDLSACGLPVSSPFHVTELSGAMKKDKKAENDRIHFVLIHKIGDVFILDLTLCEVERKLKE